MVASINDKREIVVGRKVMFFACRGGKGSKDQEETTGRGHARPATNPPVDFARTDAVKTTFWRMYHLSPS